MLETMTVDSGSVMYVMAAVGILGTLAKIVNRLTFYRLIKAAENMPKSTHRLMKLVRAKYEHACMAHDSVENIDVFVEKYIYEYRGFLFRIHTWRQVELLSVWFVGILAAIGAAAAYIENGFTETVYQYLAGGAAEAVLLMVIIRMSDEPYKIKAIKMYMVDYLENICAGKLRKQSRREKEFIDVIPSDSANAGDRSETEKTDNRQRQTDNIQWQADNRQRQTDNIQWQADNRQRQSDKIQQQADNRQQQTDEVQRQEKTGRPDVRISKESEGQSHLEWQAQMIREVLDETGSSMESKSLPINIEEEPQPKKKTEPIQRENRSNVRTTGQEEERPHVREEAIRQILEEFLA